MVVPPQGVGGQIDLAIDYNYYIVSDTFLNPTTYTFIKNVVASSPLKNIKADTGSLSRKYGYILSNPLIYVNDARHCHDFDTTDTTQYIISSGTSGTALQIDYGNVYNLKFMLCKLYFYMGTSGTYTYYIQVSQDGVSWTTLKQETRGVGTADNYIVSVTTNVQMRYWRIFIDATGSGAVTVKVYKLHLGYG
jgi:hypothetical protein